MPPGPAVQLLLSGGRSRGQATGSPGSRRRSEEPDRRSPEEARVELHTGPLATTHPKRLSTLRVCSSSNFWRSLADNSQATFPEKAVERWHSGEHSPVRATIRA